MKITSITGLGFVLALNGALAAPILQNRAVTVNTVTSTVYSTVSEVVTFYVPAPTEVPTAPAATPSDYEEDDKYDGNGGDAHQTSSVTSNLPALVAVTSTSSPSFEPTTSAPPPPPVKPKSDKTTSEPLATTSSVPIPPSSIEASSSTTISTPIYSPILVTSTTQPPTTTPMTTQVAIPSPVVQKGTDDTGPDLQGKLTFYDTGMGSCGKVNKDSDIILAAPVSFMRTNLDGSPLPEGGNPNKNPHCYQQVIIVGPNGKPVTCTIIDTCPSCLPGHFDLSRGAYAALGCEEDDGVCQMTYKITQSFTPQSTYP